MFKKTYDTLLYGMAILAGLLLVWLMVSVITSVLMRNAGLQPFAWLFTSAEYGLLYMTMLGAPWLVREKGHVHIELVTAALPATLRTIVSRGVAAACVLVCLILAWKGFDLVLTNIERGDYDTRAYYFPRWMLTIAFPLSFGMMAIEFSRFVFGTDLMHSGEAGIHE
ncbi:TRAP transporter small permease [Aliiruegeria lutimaris]|uniref:TRAP transporter small permease protein n=1 Tax=Aliiruegeria lutimaris TaxID=571298 RepID=A0A1G9L4Q0_9RHOB|nr:TRAP transporter small permease [Aliiruegeria lutimaris]SDL56891.1 TRAP-type C4-dicarboxylate transport system, small permease component [Aliiruegeria lutimaris]